MRLLTDDRRQTRLEQLLDAVIARTTINFIQWAIHQPLHIVGRRGKTHQTFLELLASQEGDFGRRRLRTGLFTLGHLRNLVEILGLLEDNLTVEPHAKGHVHARPQTTVNRILPPGIQGKLEEIRNHFGVFRCKAVTQHLGGRARRNRSIRRGSGPCAKHNAHADDRRSTAAVNRSVADEWTRLLQLVESGVRLFDGAEVIVRLHTSDGRVERVKFCGHLLVSVEIDVLNVSQTLFETRDLKGLDSMLTVDTIKLVIEDTDRQSTRNSSTIRLDVLRNGRELGVNGDGSLESWNLPVRQYFFADDLHLHLRPVLTRGLRPSLEGAGRLTIHSLSMHVVNFFLFLDLGMFVN